MEKLSFLALLAFVSSFSAAVSPAPGEGKTLMTIKASFSNVANVLLDWNADDNEDYCSWRGVACNNVSFAVSSLNLSNLNLGGEISPAIGYLKSLESLDLSSNLLYGDIPFSISKLKQLEELTLKSNQLTGPIPSTLSQIPNLKTLDLAQNQLSGDIPRLIYWNEVLQYLDVRGNNISGTIPDSIGNCTSFEILDISYNQITGEIPYNIGFLQVATLSLQGNKLTGKIPEVIGLMQALAVLDLSENELVGRIPPILGNLSYTGKLYLHNNKLTGPIPPELGNMSKLSYLQLNNNKLVGIIPPELGKLEELFELNLANNHLEGQIPVELGRIINLDTLDLSDNDFSGPVPASVGDLEHLLVLNLSQNHLNGALPAEFGNLRSVQIIDISYNKLSGEIPEELGQLQNIEALILNDNNLHGLIPAQLMNCFSLSILNLSYNNLSGYTPLSRNFSRFPAESFMGNPLLCGNWVGSICRMYASESKGIISRAAVVCIALGAIMLFCIVIVAIYRSNHSKEYFKSPNKRVQGPPKMVILHMDMAIHTYDDIMRITENLSEKYIIGYGASSTVYKCVLKNSRPIAIKRLYTQYPHNPKEFETELETIGSIKHRNLVSLHGYALSPFGNLLFYDYMENGSVWDLLHGPSKKVKLDWETRLKIAVGAAQGLSYLHHDCNPRIIHRDVKSSNILLDGNFEAHLSDFGIAKCISSAKTHASTYVMGTIGYIDPEYARTSRINEKSDVYSFGIVLLELLTGKKAVDNDYNLHQLILSKAGDNTVMDAVDSEVSVTCMDLNLVRKTFQLALLCTKRQPSERPTMHEVARVLVSLLPAPPSNKPCLAAPKVVNYSQYVVGADGKQHGIQDNDSSDARWFVRFGECSVVHLLRGANQWQYRNVDQRSKGEFIALNSISEVEILTHLDFAIGDASVESAVVAHLTDGPDFSWKKEGNPDALRPNVKEGPVPSEPGQ
ncbi:hypothetical protein ACLOJK_005303 [Asimina triloba]